jgi:mutator protein MutT
MVVVSGIIVRDGRILMTQRRGGSSLAYLWNIPGGKVESLESHRDALYRELSEEIGIRVNAAALAWTGDIRAGASGFEMNVFVVMGYIGEPQPLEGQGIGWFTPFEIHLMAQERRLSPADTVASQVAGWPWVWHLGDRS